MPRQIAMYLCKSLTHASLPEIGRSFGGKHHSTVIHSIKKVEELRKRDGDFNSLISNFLESFQLNPTVSTALGAATTVDPDTSSGIPHRIRTTSRIARRRKLSTP